MIMSKMVTDWFAGREIASAMAIFVNSWPVGIALALIALPPAGTAYGVPAVYLISSAAVGSGLHHVRSSLSLARRLRQNRSGRAPFPPAGRSPPCLWPV